MPLNGATALQKKKWSWTTESRCYSAVVQRYSAVLLFALERTTIASGLSSDIEKHKTTTKKKRRFWIDLLTNSDTSLPALEDPRYSSNPKSLCPLLTIVVNPVPELVPALGNHPIMFMPQYLLHRSPLFLALQCLLWEKD
ncbi:uncharacterized protein G2W53_008079 [Senna tora]|uniref:Uncharacterized protein n=1 Tax=Senna tora TaxID=362788 RepID=A0A835CHU3_9FABA|nr:uncharacterized protein G2W53_008079 [Senna tora]